MLPRFGAKLRLSCSRWKRRTRLRRRRHRTPGSQSWPSRRPLERARTAVQGSSSASLYQIGCERSPDDYETTGYAAPYTKNLVVVIALDPRSYWTHLWSLSGTVLATRAQVPIASPLLDFESTSSAAAWARPSPNWGEINVGRLGHARSRRGPRLGCWGRMPADDMRREGTTALRPHEPMIAVPPPDTVGR